MATSREAADWVLGQLEELEHVTLRPMFGEYGLYADGVFFGIVADGVAYLRADETSRPDFEARGSCAFQPVARGGRHRSPPRREGRTYWSVPDDVLEDAHELAAWARRAVAAARASKRSARR